MVTVNAFSKDVDALNTSLLLVVQRLAKMAEKSSKDSSEEGEDVGANKTDEGSCVILTTGKIPHQKRSNAVNSLSLNGYLYETGVFLKWTIGVGPFLLNSSVVFAKCNSS